MLLEYEKSDAGYILIHAKKRRKSKWEYLYLVVVVAAVVEKLLYHI
jgi:hypothetical protein